MKRDISRKVHFEPESKVVNQWSTILSQDLKRGDGIVQW